MRKKLVLTVGAFLMTLVSLLPAMAERPEPRSIVLVVRDMTFYLEGSPEPNPTIRVARGEQIALTLRNEDAGMTHDVAIAALGASTRALRSGASDRVTFTVPSKTGALVYLCRPHSLTMRGNFLVN
jgi:plastocyanin